MVASSFLTLALAACLPLSQALTLQERDSITRHFEGKLSKQSKIVLASDPNYANETTQRWTVYDEPTYDAAIIPATAADVQQTVKIAGKYNIPFLATGGGHGLSITLQKLQKGISIDLSNFKKVDIDKKAQTVTVGGANVYADVFSSVWNAGFEMATGSCACPGVVGATIGGGVGRLQGMHGLAVDTLKSAVVVTADGRLLTASEKENSDLFWAIRGSAWNFGIILYMTYHIFPATNNAMVFNADFIFPANMSQKHWETLKQAGKNQSQQMAYISGVRYTETYGGTNILLNAVYFGPEAEGRKLVEPFTKNSPLVTNMSYVHASKLANTAVFGLFADGQCGKGKHVNTYTAGALDVDVPTWVQHVKNFTAMYQKYPQTRGSTVFVETFPIKGVVDAKGENTAVPTKHRAITNHVLWGYQYADNSIDAAINKIGVDGRQAFVDSSGFDELQLYTTYAHGDEGQHAWYGDKLPRLQQLKKKWDPQNRFGFMNPVTAK